MCKPIPPRAVVEIASCRGSGHYVMSRLPSPPRLSLLSCSLHHRIVSHRRLVLVLQCTGTQYSGLEVIKLKRNFCPHPQLPQPGLQKEICTGWPIKNSSFVTWLHGASASGTGRSAYKRLWSVDPCIGKSPPEKGRSFRPLYNIIFRLQNIYALLLVSVLRNQVHNLWVFSVIHAADIFANVVTRFSAQYTYTALGNTDTDEMVDGIGWGWGPLTAMMAWLVPRLI